MQKSDSMAPEYELDGHASSLIYAFKRGAKHLTDIFAYSKWTLPQKGSLLVDHVIISNCPSTKGLSSSYYNVKQLSLEAIARGGTSDDSLLPKLIKDNIGSSYSQPQKDNAFAAIKKMDPSGAKTIPLLQKPLQDAFSVRGSVELLEFIGSPQCLSIAKETRKKWKLQ